MKEQQQKQEKVYAKAALFDLDGVVFDTEPLYSKFWGTQCREFHPEHPGLENEIKGQTLDQIFDVWFCGPLEEKRDLVTRRLNDFEAQMAFVYVPGFERFVSRLREQGTKTAVVASSSLACSTQKNPKMFLGFFFNCFVDVFLSIRCSQSET